MISRFPACKLLCLLLLLVIVPGSGAARPGTREVMANAMARMMEAMGLFDAAPASRDFGGVPANPWAGAWGSALDAPWDGPVPNRSRNLTMRDLMRQFARGMTPPGENGGERPSGWKPSRLEGVWEGRTGELLIVQGERFRIYSPEMQRVDGLMQTRGDRLALYNPRDRHAQPFEFVERQGRLIMRDLAGNLYLYRHLRLDSGWGRAVPRSRSRR
ncbi:MAG: hypothetical protein [Olavius algarvensis Gamma 1 endosymbiont]|nr:MAG: hypothetical protein [Olavius algarvensis Gamma 1 endosymbiont]